MGFERLIRFVGENGETYYGDLAKETPTLEIEGSTVAVLDGDIASGFRKTGAETVVKKLLCPLPKAHIITCVGLNYRQHANEAKLTVPPYPVIFTKPPDALAGPLDPIPIHPDARGSDLHLPCVTVDDLSDEPEDLMEGMEGPAAPPSPPRTIKAHTSRPPVELQHRA